MRFSQKILCCSVLLVAALMPVLAAADQETSATVENKDKPEQTTAGDSAAFPLPEIIVSAKRIAAPPTVIMREVTALDIAARNAHTAGDALTFVPGVNIQVGGASADSNVWIRGFRDRDVLLLYDGIPLASAFEGNLDLNEVSLAAIANVKVMKNAPSVIYGTNGIGGVIDVIPRTGSTEKFLNAGVEFGSDDRWLVQASGGGGNAGISYVLSGSHQQADDYSLADDYVARSNQPAGTRVNSDFERNNVFLRVDAPATTFGHTSMFLNFSDAQKGLPVEAGIDDPDYARLTQSRRSTIGLSNQFARIPLTAKLYYNGYSSDLANYTDESFSEVDEVDSAEDYTLGGKLYSSLDTTANNVLLLSGGVQKDVFQGEGELENGNKAELTSWTLALEDDYWITDRLSVAAGLIYTYFDQTRLGRTSSALNPQISLAWQALDAMSFRASVAQRTRFPKLRELYRQRYGNPDLKKQTANNYELGVEFRHGAALSSDFSIFRSDIDDLIERLDRRFLYQNLDRVTLSGVEMSSGGWVTDRAFYRLSYTYVDAAEDLPGGSSRQLRSRPKHTAMLELRYRFPRQILVSFSGIYVAGLYDLDTDDNYVRIANYFVGNIKASRPFTDRWKTYISVSNLFDENYQQRLGFPREGRAMLVGLDFGF